MYRENLLVGFNCNSLHNFVSDSENNFIYSNVYREMFLSVSFSLFLPFHISATINQDRVIGPIWYGLISETEGEGIQQRANLFGKGRKVHSMLLV